MTEDGKFVSVPDFRENATDEDYRELWNLYQSGTRNFPTKAEPKPDCRFQFSATAAKNLLDERKQEKRANGQWESIMKEHIIGEPVGLKFSEVKLEFTKRSMQMTANQWNRLQKVFDMYPITNKNYVLHAVLEYALTQLGV